MAAGIAVAGCATTQQEAVRLGSTRRGSESARSRPRSRIAGRALRVTRVALDRGRGGSAIVVRLHNPGRRTVSDLPISVGIRKGAARQRPLNVRSPAEFWSFDAHVPVIAPGRDRDLGLYDDAAGAGRARPYAIVGARPSVRAPSVTTAPVIEPIAAGAATTLASRSRCTIDSSVPQYQLQVYAVARHGRRYVAAGALTVPHLDGGGTAPVDVPLLGHPAQGRLDARGAPGDGQLASHRCDFQTTAKGPAADRSGFRDAATRSAPRDDAPRSGFRNAAAGARLRRVRRSGRGRAAVLRRLRRPSPQRQRSREPATSARRVPSRVARRPARPHDVRRQFGGSRGVALALVIALIPVAAAAGVIAGRSSNNDDSNLISALKHHQSAAGQTTTVQAKAATRPVDDGRGLDQQPAAAHKRPAKSKSSKGSKDRSQGRSRRSGKASVEEQ